MQASPTQATDARIQFLTITEMRAYPDIELIEGTTALLLGDTGPGVGSSRLYFWDESSTADDTGSQFVAGSVVKLTNTTQGRFIELGRFAAYAIDVKADFGAVGDGVTDDTDAINLASAAASASRARKVFFPAGKYKITSTLVIPSGVTFEGEAFDHNGTSTHATVIFKSFDGDGVTIGNNSVLRNFSVERDPAQITDTGDGVYLTGARATVENVSSHSHGGNGFRIGNKVTDAGNCNFWRARNIFGTFNGGDGLYVHDEVTTPTLPNANGGLLEGCDFRANTGHGIRVGQAVDCQFIGVGCQLNEENGIRLNQYAIGHYFSYPYIEANDNTSGGTEVTIDSGANRNIVFGWRGSANSDDVTDGGTSNLTLGRTNQVTNNPFIWRGDMAVQDLLVNSDSIAGFFRLKQNASTGNLDVTVEGTGSQRYFNPAQMKVNGGAPVSKLLTGSATTNFGTVGANSSATATVACTGVLVADASKYHVEASSGAALPSGIILSGGWVSADNVVTVQVANVTGGGVALNQQIRVVATQVA